MYKGHWTRKFCLPQQPALNGMIPVLLGEKTIKLDKRNSPLMNTREKKKSWKGTKQSIFWVQEVAHSEKAGEGEVTRSLIIQESQSWNEDIKTWQTKWQMKVKVRTVMDPGEKKSFLYTYNGKLSRSYYYLVKRAWNLGWLLQQKCQLSTPW